MLAEVGHDGKVLAGGQSLVPLLTMRLAAPAHLVDINRRRRARRRRGDAGRRCAVGALARHAQLERARRRAHAAQPLLRQALRHVAHPTIRNRGTTVGSHRARRPGRRDAGGARAAGRLRSRSPAPRGTRDDRRRRLLPRPARVGAAPRTSWPSRRAFRRSAGRHAAPPSSRSARRHGDYALAGVAAAVTARRRRRSPARGCPSSRVDADARSCSTSPRPVAGRPARDVDWAAAAELARAARRPRGATSTPPPTTAGTLAGVLTRGRWPRPAAARRLPHDARRGRRRRTT